jgi:hypothetical protein
MPYPDSADDTKAPYTLPFPGNNQVADVPEDIKRLAEATEKALDSKAQRGNWTNRDGGAEDGTDKLYQTRITVKTVIPTDLSNYKDGDVVFVIP